MFGLVSQSAFDEAVRVACGLPATDRAMEAAAAALPGPVAEALAKMRDELATFAESGPPVGTAAPFVPPEMTPLDVAKTLPSYSEVKKLWDDIDNKTDEVNSAHKVLVLLRKTAKHTEEKGHTETPHEISEALGLIVEIDRDKGQLKRQKKLILLEDRLRTDMELFTEVVRQSRTLRQTRDRCFRRIKAIITSVNGEPVYKEEDQELVIQRMKDHRDSLDEDLLLIAEATTIVSHGLKALESVDGLLAAGARSRFRHRNVIKEWAKVTQQQIAEYGDSATLCAVSTMIKQAEASAAAVDAAKKKAAAAAAAAVVAAEREAQNQAIEGARRKKRKSREEDEAVAATKKRLKEEEEAAAVAAANRLAREAKQKKRKSGGAAPERKDYKKKKKVAVEEEEETGLTKAERKKQQASLDKKKKKGRR
eukprot:COSAG06_NODE_178_length_20949_cov_26.114053_12_plen_422_part_00